MSTKPQSSTARHAPFILLAIAVVSLVMWSRPLESAAAQSPTPSDDQVNRIAHQLYCPVCENTPLDVCPTEACRQWRDLIRQQLSQGWSEARIKQYFQDQYGARVLAEPPAAGLNWLVYVLPPAIILAGALFLFLALRTWTKPAVGKDAGPAQVDRGRPASAPKPDEYVARLEDELKRRR